KNVLATCAQVFGATALISVLWMLLGYSIAFTDGGAFFGGLGYVLLAPMGLNATNPLAAPIPESVYMGFQMTVAIATPALISGAVAGRVAITPASGYVNPCGALIIGLLAGAVCYLAAVHMKRFFGYDDALDAWGVHGVGGALGAMLTGVLATDAINPSGKGWLTDGNARQLLVQFY